MVKRFSRVKTSEGGAMRQDVDGGFVLYQDYAALEEKMLALLDHPIMKAHTDALREAQVTGLAFIRVNANGHVQALPSDRVRISVIQAVEERTAAAAHQECDHLWACGPTSGPMPEYVECVKCRSRAPLPEDGGPVWYQECRDATPPAPCDHEFSVNDHRDKCLYCGEELK